MTFNAISAAITFESHLIRFNSPPADAIMGKKGKMLRKVVDDESVLTNTAEDNRPETS